MFDLFTVAAMGATFILWMLCIRFIPNNRIGLREVLWSNRNLESGLKALQGEAGYQPEVLRGGSTSWSPPGTACT